MINKILFTIFAVIAIWKAFSMISKLTKNTGGVPQTGKADDRRNKQPSDPEPVEMIACPRCGAYIDPRERCSCLT